MDDNDTYNYAINWFDRLVIVEAHQITSCSSHAAYIYATSKEDVYSSPKNGRSKPNTKMVKLKHCKNVFKTLKYYK